MSVVIDILPRPTAETGADALLLETMTGLVAAYVSRNHVPSDEMPALIAFLHGGLCGLGRAPRPGPVPVRPRPAVPVRSSVTDEYIVSLEDGKPYQTLKRHLARLGLEPEQYRAKWWLPRDYPMVARSYSAKRSALAKGTGFGQQRRSS